ncbi:MAG: SPOR domain-containing protein [Pseudomonadota bacterium]
MERIKQKMEEARKQREQLQHGHATSTEGVRHRKQSAFRSEKNRLFTLKDNNIEQFLSRMAVVAALAMVAWWIVPSQEPDGTRLHDLDLLESHQTSATGSPAVEKLEARITGLIERVEILTDSITYLEFRLKRAHVITDSVTGAEQKLASSTTPEPPVIAEVVRDFETLPPPAAGQTGREVSVAKTPRKATARVTTRPQDTTVIAAVATNEPPALHKPDRAVPDAPASPTLGTDNVAGGQSSTRKPLRTASSKAAVMERQDPVTKKQPAVSVDKDGPWVINLASSPSKADADRLAEKARSRDIQTEQQQVTVKGKQYWRVQIIGFSTAEEARAYGDTAKEKLGLKDIWIMKR